MISSEQQIVLDLAARLGVEVESHRALTGHKTYTVTVLGAGTYTIQGTQHLRMFLYGMDVERCRSFNTTDPQERP